MFFFNLVSYLRLFIILGEGINLDVNGIFLKDFKYFLISVFKEIIFVVMLNR